MDNHNYYPNQFNQFTLPVQNYTHSQHQQWPNPFNMASAQSSVFPANTSMPVFNQAPWNQSQNSGMPAALSKGTTAHHDVRPPPSYEESARDGLLSRSDTSNRNCYNTIEYGGNSNTRNRNYYNTNEYGGRSDTSNRNCYNTNEYGGGSQTTQKSQPRFTDFFDYPEDKKPVSKTSNWAGNNFNSSYNHERESQGRFDPPNSSSQKPLVSFPSKYGGRSENRFSHQPGPSGRESNYSQQSNKRGFDQQNIINGRNKAGFRGRGKWQNKDRLTNSGSWQGSTKLCAEDNQFDGYSMQEVKSASEGYVESSQIERGMLETEEQDPGNEERDDSDKVNVFVPSFDMVMKYEYYPPGPEEMGNMFKDLVIHFFFKVPKNKKEQNPFVVICESFRRSASYSKLDVEDGFDPSFKDRKFCTLKYNKMMMVRGCGDNNCLKEPRVRAGIELINKLAMSCYTLEAKPEYFSAQAFQSQLKNGDVPGLYCIVPREKAYDFESARNYLRPFVYDDDSDIEHMFNLPKIQDSNRLKGWANHLSVKFDSRVIIKDKWIGIYKHRTPQYWRDKMLASGSMENERFILTPPQGIGNFLVPKFNVKNYVVQLRNRLPVECSLQHIYGPPGVGPRIIKALPPWERGGTKKSKKNQQRERKIMESIKQGVPLDQAKGFKFLNKHKKKKIKQRLNLL